jgi:hypothetical protein
MNPGTSNRALTRSAVLALACALFVLVLGARWALLASYGTDLPDMDQWDAEGLALLQPASQGQLRLASFLLPHNEHRIVLTRLMAFGLTRLNGQWDQRLEAACNAVLPGAIAAGLWLLAAPRLRGRWQVGFGAALAAVYALPLAWENILAGFDSQQFFLIGLAIAGIVLLPFAEPYRLKWWLGAASVLLSLGSMGSGFFAAVIVAGLLTFQLERARRPFSTAVPGLVVCAIAIATGVMSRFVVVGHESLKAQSAADFVLTLAKALGWPAFDFGWGYSSLLLFLPWGLVVARTLKRQPAHPEVALHPASLCSWDELLVGLGLWVVAQALATAYARGAEGPSPAFRYMDTLIVGNLVNLLCLHALWQSNARLPGPTALLRALTVGWIGLFAVGIVSEVHYIQSEQLPPLLDYHRYSEQNVRNYLATGDSAYLHHAEIPYPGEVELRTMLDLPGLANRLPASVRRPIALSAGGEQRGFQREDSRVPQRRNPLHSPGAGLAPVTPVLANAVTWGSYGAAAGGPAAKWRSAAIQASPRSWLKFELAGDAGESGQTLTLRDPASDRVLAEVRPDRTPGKSWRSAYVRAPAGSFIVAAQSAPSGWLAFSQPVEISAGSFWIRRWVAYGSGLELLGVLGAVLVIARAFGRQRFSGLGTTRST